MTRARTVGEKRRLKKLARDMPKLAEVPKKQPNGRTRRTSEDRNKATQNLKARCRQVGKEITNANMREASAPWYGCNAGRVIADTVMPSEERAELWDAICDMRRITAAYDASIGAPRRHPACLRLLAPTDGISATAETPPIDTRSPEDKARQAQARWTALHGWLCYADAPARHVALTVVLDDQHCADNAGLIQALRCVSDGKKGRAMVYRGRAVKKS